MQKKININKFAEAVLRDRYLYDDETLEERFNFIANLFCKYEEHDVDNKCVADFTERMTKYMHNLWFIPSTPILSKGEHTNTGLPISCYLNKVDDSLDDILYKWSESAWLGALGGGIGTDWSMLRSAGQPISRRGVSSGIIPFMKVSDSTTLAVSQGSLRRGASACYLDISHPEIEEFLEIRTTSGDFNRKSLNIHHGVTIGNDFMDCVVKDKDWELVDPKKNKVVKILPARELYTRLLEIRLSTGEPYIVYKDNVNDNLASHHKDLGLNVSQSNLCSEIMLPTGKDDLGIDRTAVCCLGSVNLELYDEWKDDPQFIADCLRFLRKVLGSFIYKTKSKDMYWFRNARYSAMLESSVGLGVMGLHSYFQRNMIPFSSATARRINKEMFARIRYRADKFNNLKMTREAILHWSNRIKFEKGKDRFKHMDREIYSIRESGDVLRGTESWGLTKNPIWDMPFCWDHIRQIAKSKEFLDGGKKSFDVRRFSYMLAVAPTANISIVGGGCSPCTEPISSNYYTHKTLTGGFHVKNKYLQQLLEKYESEGVDISGVWDQIVEDNGSVRSLKFLSCKEKSVFLTAYEVDQNSIIRMAGDRAEYIDQGQSINLFLKSNVSKEYLLKLHMNAWRFGIKSLYYLRSQSLQRAGFGGGVEADNTMEREKVFAHAARSNDGEVCEVCQ